MKTAVIKYGGHAMELPELRVAFANDLNSLANAMNFVIVHGGGPQIGRMLKRLDIKSEFVGGLRVTDDKTLEIVEMVLCGQVNKEVTGNLLKNGIQAAGISGEDGDLLTAEAIDQRLGFVGRIVAVNPKLPKCLLAGGFLPVIAPLARDSAGRILNVNADTAAGSIAGALQADFFILISDVPGVLDANGMLIKELSGKDIEILVADGTIHGGMLPKVKACLNALACGTNEAFILDGRKPGSLARYLLAGEGMGTLIRK